jgi:hypothetical protein
MIGAYRTGPANTGTGPAHTGTGPVHTVGSAGFSQGDFFFGNASGGGCRYEGISRAVWDPLVTRVPKDPVRGGPQKAWHSHVRGCHYQRLPEGAAACSQSGRHLVSTKGSRQRKTSGPRLGRTAEEKCQTTGTHTSGVASTNDTPREPPNLVRATFGNASGRVASRRVFRGKYGIL